MYKDGKYQNTLELFTFDYSLWFNGVFLNQWKTYLL